MTGLLAALVGLLTVAGTIAIVAGLRRRDVLPRAVAAGWGAQWARLSRRPKGRAGRRRDLLIALSLGIGVLGAAITGWVVALLLVPLVMVGLPAVLATPKARESILLEALDRWVRSLVATLPTGRSIPDAIRLSRRTAPQLLASPLATLVARLDARWSTRDALLGFADDLASPQADGVVAALILAADRGSTGATTTLSELAESIQAQLRGRREIETERAKPYVVVRQVTVITVLTALVVVLIGRQYFAPYGTALGQAILAGLLVAYVAALALMRFQARATRHERILVRSRA